MSESKPPVGTVGWFDLTIENADEVRDFYAEVVGWKHSPLSMGTYNDYVMTTPESGDPVAGVCHARGQNAGLPAAWLMYVNVADILASVEACKKANGELISPIRKIDGQGKFCVIKDPAGAVLALFEPV